MLGPVSVTEKEGVDAMRQSDMINSIVQTEHHAQEITAEAERKRKNLDADVAAEVEKLNEPYRQEAQRRIAEAEQLEAQQREKSLQELQDRLQEALDDIERKEKENHDEWVQALFQRIIENKGQEG